MTIERKAQRKAQVAKLHKCGGCVWFLNLCGPAGWGECHRFPPRNGQPNATGLWMWCGEFSRATARATARRKEAE